MSKIDVIERDRELYFYRLTINQRIQHILLFVSFTALAATGLPLKFHNTWWGPTVYSFVGGITFAPIFHRISAVIITLAFLYHVLYVLVCSYRYYILPLKQEGTLTFRNALLALMQMPMVPNLNDLKELVPVLKYFLFLTNKRPYLGFHGLKEKFGYLAVFWGMPVIGISGYFLWGKTFFTRYFSGQVLNFAYIAHSDEAFLACIVIFIWHLYNVHLAPAVFPMGGAWLNGLIDEREMVEYHYEDYLKAMSDAGLQDRILPNTLEMCFRPSFWSRVFKKIYTGIYLVAIIIATVVICRVIYESAFILGYQIVTTEPKPKAQPPEESKFFEEVVLPAAEGQTLYRGYRFLEERNIKKHYHRIELKVGPEPTSTCITCHGDLPHGKSEKIKAFLNMHNLYLACQTCHVRPQEGQKQLPYYWYNRSTGAVVLNPKIGFESIDSLNIKLTPCRLCGDKLNLKKIEEERAAAKRLLNELKKPNLSIAQKKEIIKEIHKNTAKHPVSCVECHTKKNPYLPLLKAGYPPERAAMIASDDITNMIDRYAVFFNPTFMEPETQTGKE